MSGALTLLASTPLEPRLLVEAELAAKPAGIMSSPTSLVEDEGRSSEDPPEPDPPACRPTSSWRRRSCCSSSSRTRSKAGRMRDSWTSMAKVLPVSVGTVTNRITARSHSVLPYSRYTRTGGLDNAAFRTAHSSMRTPNRALRVASKTPSVKRPNMMADEAASSACAADLEISAGSADPRTSMTRSTVTTSGKAMRIKSISWHRRFL